MARVAPGEGDDRNTTGTQSGFRSVRRIGDVLRVQDHLVVVWHRTPEALWIGLPIAAQAGPLHRSHMTLTPQEVAPFCESRALRSRLIVRTAQPELIPDDARRVVGHLDIEVAQRIGRTLRHALAASLTERGGHAL
jgi:hypothetical protein